MTDGPVTIPMMVQSGYKPHLAAAIEAVASNGGQILPPVMGITAFLIADWLNIPYSDVVIAALFPAILYYVALFVQIDLEAARSGLKGLPLSQAPFPNGLLWMLDISIGLGTGMILAVLAVRAQHHQLARSSAPDACYSTW